jgi:hypothetical protein
MINYGGLFMNTKLSIFIVASILALTGCYRVADQTRTYEVSKTGENYQENKAVQMRVGPCGKRVINRQVLSEKIKCVDRKGVVIPAATPEECIKLKGKVVEEVYIEEESYRK